MRRSPLRRKAKIRRERSPWLPPRTRLSGPDMQKLRAQAFERSEGYCECGEKDCKRRVFWTDGQLHHVISRAKGGSDVLENVRFVTRDCDRRIHGEPQWSRGILSEYA